MPPVSCSTGSLDPPLRITFFAGGQGFSVGDAAFVETVVGEPGLADAAPGPLLESAELLTSGFSGVGAVEQLGMVFRRRGWVGDGFAEVEGVGCRPGVGDAGWAGDDVCGCD